MELWDIWNSVTWLLPCLWVFGTRATPFLYLLGYAKPSELAFEGSQGFTVGKCPINRLEWASFKTSSSCVWVLLCGQILDLLLAPVYGSALHLFWYNLGVGKLRPAKGFHAARQGVVIYSRYLEREIYQTCMPTIDVVLPSHRIKFLVTQVKTPALQTSFYSRFNSRHI